MLATVLSHSGDLLVVREQRANLPSLVKQGRYAPSNVHLVAQLDGESHHHFVSRVLTKIMDSSGQLRPFRSAIVSLQANPEPNMVESRIRLLSGITLALAPRSDSELVILAPHNVGGLERIRLFELVEATLHAVPTKHVMRNLRLVFAAPEANDRRVSGSEGKSAQLFEA